MRSILFLTCLLYTSANYGQSKDTFEVYFSLNSAKISREAEAYIDNLIFKDTLIHGDKLMVLGFADYIGNNGHNDTLSMKRAGVVRDYLIKFGFDKEDITLCVGKGKIDRKNINGKGGHAPDRKVQIVIVHAPPGIVKQREKTYIQPKPAAPKEKIDIATLKINDAIALNNLYFDPGTDLLLPQSASDLKNLLTVMKENPSVTIRIEGHVCCLGPIEGMDGKYKGRYLSGLRAEAVFKYLASNGVSEERMKFIGLGNNNPIVKEEVTEEDRQKNRRVEIRILSK